MENLILKIAEKSNKKGMSLKDFFSVFEKIDQKKIKKTISKLVKKAKLIKKKNIFFIPKFIGLFEVEIVQDCNGFLIAKKLEDESKILIAKKFSKGALLKDLALVYEIASKIEGKKFLKEAKVEKIYEKNSTPFTGVIFKKHGKFLLKPDTFSQSYFKIRKSDEKNLNVYDKVVAKVFKRHEIYSEIICSIISNCKSSKTAINCARAIALSQGVEFSFSHEVLKAAKNLEEVEKRKKSPKRLDLTKELIFTIDGKTAKDLDDAISIEKKEDCYVLGVHIADVSHYVEQNSPIDVEALKRGTSIYFANTVVPMLPEELSNNLCSLNANEKKLAFSVFLKVDFSGKLLSYKFFKTIISSKIKGVYEEINDVLKKNKKSQYFEKYEKFLPTLKTMLELFKILKRKKIKRGTPQIVTKESIVVLNEQKKAVDIQEKKSGISEELIEEFMILANEAVATFAKKNKLPFLFRVHESPKSEKVINLRNLLKQLKLSYSEVKPGLKPKILADILKKYEKTELFSILNINILRSMSKAEYDTKPIGHFGLVLENYAHFTSPIRRYPDLLIHRILSDFIFNNHSIEDLTKRYNKFNRKAAKSSSSAEKKAISIERGCLNCFKAEFIKDRIGEVFEGEISSIIDRGIFVMLKNTVEGFVSIKNIPSDFEFCDNLQFFSKKQNKSYKIGQKVKVCCINSNVSLGKVDFKFC